MDFQSIFKKNRLKIKIKWNKKRVVLNFDKLRSRALTVNEECISRWVVYILFLSKNIAL